jgi:hypothetical protein
MENDSVVGGVFLNSVVSRRFMDDIISLMDNINDENVSDYYSIFLPCRESIIADNFNFNFSYTKLNFRSPDNHFYLTNNLPSQRLYTYTDIANFLENERPGFDMGFTQEEYIDMYRDIFTEEVRLAHESNFYEYDIKNPKLHRYLKFTDCWFWIDNFQDWTEESHKLQWFKNKMTYSNPYVWNAYNYYKKIDNMIPYEEFDQIDHRLNDVWNEQHYRVIIGQKQSADDEGIPKYVKDPKIERDLCKQFDAVRQSLIASKITGGDYDDFVAEKKRERKKYNESSKIKIDKPAVGKKDQSMVKVHEKKQHDRAGYLLRKCAPNTPWALVPDNFEGTELARLEFYNRSHMCPCKRRYNFIKYVPEEFRYRVWCDHRQLNDFGECRETILAYDDTGKCTNCGNVGLNLIFRRSCFCDKILACTECKKTFYIKNLHSAITCICLTPDDPKKAYIPFKFFNFISSKKTDRSYAQVALAPPKLRPIQEKKVTMGGKSKFFKSLQPLEIIEDLPSQTSEIITGEKQMFTGVFTTVTSAVKAAFQGIKQFIIDTITDITKGVSTALYNFFFRDFVEILINLTVDAVVCFPDLFSLVNLFIALFSTTSFGYAMSLWFNIGMLATRVLQTHKQNIKNYEFFEEQRKNREQIEKDLSEQTKTESDRAAERLIQLFQLVKDHDKDSILSVFNSLAQDQYCTYLPLDLINEFRKCLMVIDHVEYAKALKPLCKFFKFGEFQTLLRKPLEAMHDYYEKAINNGYTVPQISADQEIIFQSLTLVSNHKFDRRNFLNANILELWHEIEATKERAKADKEEERRKAQLVSEEPIVEPIAGESQSFNFSDIFDFTCTFLGIPIIAATKFFSINLLRNFNTIFSAVRNFSTLFKTWVEFLPEFLKVYFTPELGKDWLKKQLEDESTLAARVAHAAIAVRIAIDLQVGKDEIVRLRTIARELLTELELFVLENKLVVDISISRWLVIMRDIINSAVTGIQRKKEPFCIRITGPPGCMKSTFWASIVSVLFDQISVSDIENQLTYTRNPGVEFWDGLNVDKHRIVLYDDFGQNTEELEFPEIISLVSKAPFLPPMASIDNTKSEMGYKGQQYAPDLVVLLSNVRKVSGPKTINFSEAIERRPHITINFPDTVKKGHDLDKVTFTWHRSSDFMGDQSAYGVSGLHTAILRTYKQYATDNAKIHDLRAKYAFRGHGGVNICTRVLQTAKEETMTDKLVDVIHDRNGYYIKTKEKKNPFVKRDVHDADSDYDASNQCSSDSSEEPDMTPVSVIRKGEKQGFGRDIFKNLLSSVLSNFVIFPSLKNLLNNKYSSLIYNFFIKPIAISSWKEIALKVLLFSGSIVSFLLILYAFNKSKIDYIFGEQQSGTTNTKDANNMRIVTGAKQNYTPGFIHQNQCTVTVNGKRVLGLFIKGTILMTVRHVFCEVDNEPSYVDTSKAQSKMGDQNINFVPKNSEIILKFSTGQEIHDEFDVNKMREIYEDGDEMSDIVLYECSNVVSAKRDITSHFVSTDVKLEKKAIVFNGINITDGARWLRHSIVEHDRFTFAYNVGVMTWAVAKSFSYPINTIKGDCGGFISTDEAQPKIVGIHIGCYTKDHVTGVATRITKQVIERTLDKFKVPLIQEALIDGKYQMSVESLHQHDDRFGSRIAVLGNLQGCKAFPVGQTDIKPSPLYDRVKEHTTAPAVTRIFDRRLNGRNLVLEGVNKYGKQLPTFGKELNELVYESLLDDINIPSKTQPYILNQDEAINGTEDINGLDMSTSAGYPFSCVGRGGEKKKLFDAREDRWYPRPELQELLNLYEQKFESGVIPFLPWVDCLKDERRSLEKVRLCKTRIFSSASVIYIILFKKYYGAFIQHFNELRITTFNRIGINKDSIEWDEHIRKLIEVGKDNGMDLDYTAMDGNNTVENVNLFFDLADQWYNHNHPIVRKVFREIEAHGVHIMFDKDTMKWMVYQLLGGTNSGTLITGILNTISNEANMRRSWILIVPNLYRDLYYFKRFVRTAIFGDDIDLAVHPLMKEHFNAENICNVLAIYGIVLTTGSKDTDFGWKKVRDCVFLKNKSGVFANRYVPLMQEDPMLEPLNWIRSSDFIVSEDQACEDNCNGVLRNCFWYGPAYFNDIRSKILKEKPEYKLLSYHTLLKDFVDYEMLPDPLSLGGARTRNV